MTINLTTFGAKLKDKLNQMDRDLAAWRGIHEGSVIAMEARIKRLETALKSDNDTIRLALGELSAQDMRNIRAAFNWVLTTGEKANES